MNTELTGNADLISNVLSSWNIVPDDASPISTNGNWHWRVQCGRDAFVLRKYRQGQSDSTIRYELDILKRLHSRGWPVASAVDGIVLHSGFIFALFPFLPGRPHERENHEQKRRRGGILAELHRDLSAITDVEQRAVWQRADEVPESIDALRPPTNGMTHRIALDLERVRDRLRTAGVSSCPVTVVHGDFIAQNLLFQEEELSGVLDFDSAHLDLRASDVACARRSCQDEVVRGYMEVAPLTEVELGCLDDLWRASVLRYALQILRCNMIAQRHESELQWCVKQLEKTIPFGSTTR